MPTSGPIIFGPKSKGRAWSLKPRLRYLFGCYFHQSLNSSCHTSRGMEMVEVAFSFVEEGGGDAALAQLS